MKSPDRGRRRRVRRWLPPLAALLLGGTVGGAAVAAEAPVHASAALRPPVLRSIPSGRWPAGAPAGAAIEVDVAVTVSPGGAVTQAEVRGAPAGFDAAAREAAMQARFDPATRGGLAAQGTATIRVRFEPPSVPEAPRNAPSVTKEVVVTARRDELDAPDTHARTALGAEALDREAGADLGEILSTVPGVASARGTADTSKPVVRGQQERRLLLLVDGVRHENQKWGGDHAPEIDPMAAGSLQVIKGAAGVRYGPDAIGGVVLVEPRPLRFEPGVDGRGRFVVVSNGLRLLGGLRVDVAPAPLRGFAFRVEGNYSRGAAARAPDYVLGNTASQTWNLGVTAGLHLRGQGLELSYRHHDLDAGICYCARAATPSDFLGSFDRAAPLGAERWTADFGIGRPRQAVTHDVAHLRWTSDLRRAGSLRVDYSFQFNHRQEYEHARQAVEGPQYDFALRTHHLDAVITQPRWRLGLLFVEGQAGVALSAQDNVYGGLPLIPNHRALGLGIFGLERLILPRGSIEAGARYDRQARTSYLTVQAFRRHQARGALDTDRCDVDEAAARCEQAWDAASVSVGGRWVSRTERVELRVDLSSATRFPNGDELYMNGSAPTSPVYALGDPSLGAETTWGASPTLRIRLPALHVDVSAYLNVIDGFIYFAPDLAPDGSTRFDVTVRGAFPRFSYRAIDALFYGFDGGLTVGPAWPVSASIDAAVVRGIDVSDGSGLVLLPPDRFGGQVRVRLPPLGPLHGAALRASGEYALPQTHVAPGADLAPPPSPYLLLGASLSTSLAVRGADITLSLEVNDLLNRPRRDPLSLLRYYADDPGRELRFRVDVDF
jgi:iron complex outermembrane receptor protein